MGGGDSLEEEEEERAALVGVNNARSTEEVSSVHQEDDNDDEEERMVVGVALSFLFCLGGSPWSRVTSRAPSVEIVKSVLSCPVLPCPALLRGHECWGCLGAVQSSAGQQGREFAPQARNSKKQPRSRHGRSTTSSSCSSHGKGTHWRVCHIVLGRFFWFVSCRETPIRNPI